MIDALWAALMDMRNMVWVAYQYAPISLFAVFFSLLAAIAAGIDIRANGLRLTDLRILNTMAVWGILGACFFTAVGWSLRGWLPGLLIAALYSALVLLGTRLPDVWPGHER